MRQGCRGELVGAPWPSSYLLVELRRLREGLQHLGAVPHAGFLAGQIDQYAGQLRRLIQVSIPGRRHAEEDLTHADSDIVAEPARQLETLTQAALRLGYVPERTSAPEEGRSLPRDRLLGPIDGQCLVEPGQRPVPSSGRDARFPPPPRSGHARYRGSAPSGSRRTGTRPSRSGTASPPARDATEVRCRAPVRGGADRPSDGQANRSGRSGCGSTRARSGTG
jgi:hypothetical protein